MDRPGARIELDRGGRQETAARKDVPAKVGQPGVAEREQARRARRPLLDGIPDLAREDRGRLLECGELQALLASEVADQAALAHPELGGEFADRDTFEAVQRRLVDRCRDDRRAAVGDLCGGSAGHPAGEFTKRTIVLYNFLSVIRREGADR